MTNSQKLKQIGDLCNMSLNANAADVASWYAVMSQINQIVQQKPTRASKTDWSEDSIQYTLADELHRLIRKRVPNMKRPNMQMWCKHIDYMVRIDGTDPNDIGKVIRWCQQDVFWQSMVLSTEKLRAQYVRLYDLMCKDSTWMSKQKLMDRQVEVKKGPTMCDLLKEQHG